MERIKLKMIKNHLDNIPKYELPDGYSIRMFEEGDERLWAEVETAAGEFSNIDQALQRFHKEFGSHIEEMKYRCLFIENNSGDVIGTTTAWFGQLPLTDSHLGRIHFVAIKPEYQGKKLSKPLLSAALKKLREFGHKEVYLTTQTTSYPAINMYLNYGFEPYDPDNTDQKGWLMMEDILNRKLNI